MKVLYGRIMQPDQFCSYCVLLPAVYPSSPLSAWFMLCSDLVVQDTPLAEHASQIASRQGRQTPLCPVVLLSCQHSKVSLA